MKISERWLRDFVDVHIPSDVLAERLTLAGIEISGLAKLTANLSAVVVGHVLDRQKHPQADRLSVCRVDVGPEVVTIICGAPNVAADQKVPVALVGSVLPNGLTIASRPIRGVLSQGMICSEKELGISEEAAGIMVLDADSPVGRPLQEVLPLEDVIFQAELTPNRPDCLSMIGIAREVAIILGQKMHRPEVVLQEGGQPIDEQVTVELLDSHGCPRYAACLITGVKIGPSPLWLSRRLMAAGVRSINNVVDITNYVMLEMGQPLHAFDFDLLSRGQIKVRRALPGETFVTLDEREHVLTPEILLICDAIKPVALAGIMGGLESEVRPSTRNILLESAYFQPAVIRRGSKRLNISTESSQRFERGVDPNGVADASRRAAQLIVQMAGGEVARGLVDQYPQPIAPLELSLRSQRVNQILGTQLTEKELTEFLVGLGCAVRGANPLIVRVPTFRPDIAREIDLVEEVARLYGYDRITSRVYDGGTLAKARGQEDQEDQAHQQIKAALCNLGLQEVITNSLTDPKLFSAIDLSDEPRHLLNPLSEDLSVLRTSLIPGLLQVAQRNLRRAMRDMRLFELGKIFLQPPEGQVTDERWRLCGLIAGKRWPLSWDQRPATVDFYDLKGLLESFLEKLSIDNFHFLPYDERDIYQAGQSAGLLVAEDRCGSLGQLSSKICSSFDIGAEVFLFEMDVSSLAAAMAKGRRYQDLAKFPAADRDLAIVLAEDISADSVASAIRQAGGELVVAVSLFDLYHGQQIPKGHKGMAYSIRYQSADRTLTDEEIDQRQKLILEALRQKFNAQLRQ